MEMTQFFNQFVKDAQTLTILAIAGGAFLAIFSVLYNRWMDDLGEKKRGYTALLVAVGTAMTLGVVALISWRAALLALVAFMVSGLAMILGDISREHTRREKETKAANKRPRRKALPYAAASLVDEASMLLSDAQREILRALDGKVDAVKLGKPVSMSRWRWRNSPKRVRPRGNRWTSTTQAVPRPCFPALPASRKPLAIGAGRRGRTCAMWTRTVFPPTITNALPRRVRRPVRCAFASSTRAITTTARFMEASNGLEN